MAIYNVCMNITNFLNDILNKNLKLIAFGETYHGVHEVVIKEIVSHISNFSTIFIEKPISMQPSIDEYIHTENISERLESHIQNSAKEGKDVRKTTLMILDVARLKKIPIFCVDSSKIKTGEYAIESTTGKYFLHGSSRDEDMFVNMKKMMGKDKSIFFGGFQHLVNGIHFRSGEKTLGSRLHEEYGDKFYSCAIYKLKEKDSNIIVNDIAGFDMQKEKPSSELIVFLKSREIMPIDKQGKLIFDGYILHK